MNEIAKSISESLEEIYISQKNPMNNIIENEYKFSAIKDEFLNNLKIFK